MSPLKTIAITGAAGNLGGLLARYLANSEVKLHLLVHRKDVPDELKHNLNVYVFRVDLANKDTLYEALKGVDVVIHFAGIEVQDL